MQHSSKDLAVTSVFSLFYCSNFICFVFGTFVTFLFILTFFFSL